MISLTPKPVGWTARTGGSMFQNAPFSSALGAPTQKALGQTEQQWYTRAKAAVSAYDDLWARAQKIADKTQADHLASTYHGSDVVGTRGTVAAAVSAAEDSTPTNYLVFTPQVLRDRVTKLEDTNTAFKADVEQAEKAATAPPSTSNTGMPGWLVPAGIGLGILVIGALLFSGD